MNDSVCSRPLFAPKPGLPRARLSPLALLQCTGGRGRRLLALLLPFFCGLAWGQTHPQQASVANRTMTFHPQTLPGHPHRKPPQRLQPAQPVSETGREADWSFMAELAVVPSHLCHSAVAGRSVSSGCSGSAGHADIGTTMNIYTQPTLDHQRAAVEKAGQLVTNGYEFAISGRLIRQPTMLIQ